MLPRSLLPCLLPGFAMLLGSLLLGCGGDDGGSPAPGVRFESSPLPLVTIETGGAAVPDEPKILAGCRVIRSTEEGGRNTLETAERDWEGPVGIELRGSSSLLFPKKSFTVELWRELPEDGFEGVSAALLGEGTAEEDWVLYAPYSDKTLLRNVLAYALAAASGRYAPRTRFVELFVNQADASGIANSHYEGVYVLTEKVKRASCRVDISSLKSSGSKKDLSGGWLLEMTRSDKLKEGDQPFSTTVLNTMFNHVYPKQEDVTAEGLAWIGAHLDGFEAVLGSPGFADPEAGYARLIDRGTFIDYMLLNELAKNLDAFGASTFVYKDRGGRLCMGPVWDMDLGFGNCELEGGFFADPTGFMLPARRWAGRLLQDPAFLAAYAARWHELRGGEWSDSAVLALIDAKADLVAEAQARNFVRWPVLGRYVWPNPPEHVAQTWLAEVDWLRGWFRTRAHWLDANL